MIFHVLSEVCFQWTLHSMILMENLPSEQTELD
jgi:hypothetical protein